MATGAWAAAILIAIFVGWKALMLALSILIPVERRARSYFGLQLNKAGLYIQQIPAPIVAAAVDLALRRSTDVLRPGVDHEELCWALEEYAAATIAATKGGVMTPDEKSSWDAIETVAEARFDYIKHF